MSTSLAKKKLKLPSLVLMKNWFSEASAEMRAGSLVKLAEAGSQVWAVVVPVNALPSYDRLKSCRFSANEPFSVPCTVPVTVSPEAKV